MASWKAPVADSGQGVGSGPEFPSGLLVSAGGGNLLPIGCFGRGPVSAA